MKKILVSVALILGLVSCQKKPNTRCYVCTSSTTEYFDGGAVAGYSTTTISKLNWCEDGSIGVRDYEKFKSYKTSKKERVTICR